MSVRVDLGRRSYTVYFRPLSEVPALLREANLEPGRTVVVSDENVAAYYLSPLQEALEETGWRVRPVVLPPGESTKSSEHLQRIYDEALEWGIDRRTPVIALGGGVVGDLAGYAAATLLRGVPLVHLPTSLLAQVDASVGGKTAINHATGKNLIGAFYQPELVCADPDTLDTLPPSEYTSGLSEAVKHALIQDSDLFARFENKMDLVLSRSDRDLVSSMVEQAVRVKADVVGADETEQGRRAILNFGHTFGHAIEHVAGYGSFSHGEAVAVGMRAAIHLSHARRPETVDRDRLDRLVRTIPVNPDPSVLSFSTLYDAMSTDKKNRGNTIRFVLLERLGEAYVTGDVSRAEAREAWEFACSY